MKLTIIYHQSVCGALASKSLQYTHINDHRVVRIEYSSFLTRLSTDRGPRCAQCAQCAKPDSSSTSSSVGFLLGNTCSSRRECAEF